MEVARSQPEPPDPVPRELLERVACGDTLPDVLDLILRWLEAESPGSVCSILLLSDDGQTLRLDSGPSLTMGLRQLFESTQVSPDAGTWGAAVFRKQHVSHRIPEPGSLASELRRLAPQEGPLRSESWPLSSQAREVIGVLNRLSGESSASGVLPATRAATAIGLIESVLDRRRSADLLRASHERFRDVFQRQQTLKGLMAQATAAAVAHEINNLAAAVLGSAELAISGLAESDPAKVHIAHIRESCRRATVLVSKLMRLGGRAQFEPRELLLQPVLEEGARVLQLVLPPEVKVTSHFTSDSVLVMADPGQIHHILLSLGRFAAQGLSESGRILELRVEPSRIAERTRATSGDLREGRYMRLTIETDAAFGDFSACARPFDVLADAESGGIHGPELAAIRSLMKSLKGAISVEPRKERGTAFHAYFPVSEKQPVVATPPVETTARGGRHVLCVDDDEVIVYITTRALRRLGYQVTGFLNSRQALEAFRASPQDFDIVVTDLSMPGMTGPELATEIRQIRSGIPVVLTSGCIRPEDVQTAERLGSSEVLPKPASVEEMGRVLQRLLNPDATASASSENTAGFYPPASR